MTVHHRRLKLIELEIDGTTYECQVSSWTIENNTDDGERHFTFCPDGEFREDADPDYALALTFFSDWRKPTGLSHYLWEHDQQWVNFRLDHHPDIPDEHVAWSGQVRLKAPNVGGDVRTEEITEITLPIRGKPTYHPNGEESPS